MTDTQIALQKAPYRAEAFVQSESFSELRRELNAMVQQHYADITEVDDPAYVLGRLSRINRLLGGDREQIVDGVPVQILVRAVAAGVKRLYSLVLPADLLRFHQRPDTVSVIHYVEIGRGGVRSVLIPLLDERILRGFVLRSDALRGEKIKGINILSLAISDVLDDPQPCIEPAVAADWFSALQLLLAEENA